MGALEKKVTRFPSSPDSRMNSSASDVLATSKVAKAVAMIIFRMYGLLYQ
jgi:hypothetical protein